MDGLSAGKKVTTKLLTRHFNSKCNRLNNMWWRPLQCSFDERELVSINLFSCPSLLSHSFPSGFPSSCWLRTGLSVWVCANWCRLFRKPQLESQSWVCVLSALTGGPRATHTHSQTHTHSDTHTVRHTHSQTHTHRLIPWLNVLLPLSQVPCSGLVEPYQGYRCSQVDRYRDHPHLAALHPAGCPWGSGLRHDRHGLQRRTPQDLSPAPHADVHLHEGMQLHTQWLTSHRCHRHPRTQKCTRCRT